MGLRAEASPHRLDLYPTGPDSDSMLESGDIPFKVVDGSALVRGKIARYKGAFPEQRMLEGIAILISGCGGDMESSEDLMAWLASNGIANLIYDPLRDSNATVRENVFDPQLLHAQTVEAIFTDLRASTSLQSSIPDGSTLDYDTRLLLPNSMGGLAAVRYLTSLSPSEQRDTKHSIIFLQSVGFASPTPRKLVGAAPVNILDCVINEALPYFTDDGLTGIAKKLGRLAFFYGRRPDRTAGELASCVTNDITAKVRALGEAGVRSAFLMSATDLLVPNPEVQGVVNIVAFLHGRGHFASQVHAPDTALAILAVAQQLDVVNISQAA